jgi:hypothetical protein
MIKAIPRHSFSLSVGVLEGTTGHSASGTHKTLCHKASQGCTPTKSRLGEEATRDAGPNMHTQ